MVFGGRRGRTGAEEALGFMPWESSLFYIIFFQNVLECSVVFHCLKGFVDFGKSCREK